MKRLKLNLSLFKDRAAPAQEGETATVRKKKAQAGKSRRQNEIHFIKIMTGRVRNIH